MNEVRSGFGMVLLGNGKVLAAGGSQSGIQTNTAELYNPSTGTWSYTGVMNNAVSGAGFAVLSSSSSDTTVLRAGGASPGGTLSTAEIYTASTGSWLGTGSMSNGRSSFGTVKLTSGHVLVVAGVLGGPSTSTEEYTPAAGTWATKASMNNSRSQFRLVLLNSGDVLAAGGQSGSGYLSTSETFAP